MEELLGGNPLFFNAFLYYAMRSDERHSEDLLEVILDAMQFACWLGRKTRGPR
jgi:hypothetical protein